MMQQIGELDKALGRLRTRGFGPGTGPFEELWRIRGRVFGQVGFKFPREITQILRIIGLSPGTLAIWFDIEAGWMVEARISAGAAPVYRSISADAAIDILQGKLTHEFEAELMEPIEYFGE